MGDKTWYYDECPHCGSEKEVFDQPSSILWSNTCDECGWTDRLEYYEEKDGYTIHKLTTEEARKIKDKLYQPPHGITKKQLAQRLAKYDKTKLDALKNTNPNQRKE